MNWLKGRSKKVLAVCVAVLALLTAFGVALSEDQSNAITGAVESALQLFVAPADSGLVD